MRPIFLGAATSLAVLLTTAPPAVAQTAATSAGKSKVVYGWAVDSGDSAVSIAPRKATHTLLGESGLLAWELGRSTGAPLTIGYTKELDFRQVNKKCGRPSAGYPYDTSSKNAFGTTRCLPGHLRKLLKRKLPVRIEYVGSAPGPLTAIKVQELVLP